MLRIINSEEQPRIRRGGSLDRTSVPEEKVGESVDAAGGSQTKMKTEMENGASEEGFWTIDPL